MIETLLLIWNFILKAKFTVEKLKTTVDAAVKRALGDNDRVFIKNNYIILDDSNSPARDYELNFNDFMKCVPKIMRPFVKKFLNLFYDYLYYFYHLDGYYKMVINDADDWEKARMIYDWLDLPKKRGVIFIKK